MTAPFEPNDLVEWEVHLFNGRTTTCPVSVSKAIRGRVVDSSDTHVAVRDLQGNFHHLRPESVRRVCPSR